LFSQKQTSPAALRRLHHPAWPENENCEIGFRFSQHRYSRQQYRLPLFTALAVTFLDAEHHWS
jgi:hypothetical protein